MLRNLTFNSIAWIVLGLIFFIWGSFLIWQYGRFITRAFPLPLGALLTGTAMILCGLTNGFTDHSPLGRKLKKLGTLFFLGGLPFLLYAFWQFIMQGGM